MVRKLEFSNEVREVIRRAVSRDITPKCSQVTLGDFLVVLTEEQTDLFNRLGENFNVSLFRERVIGSPLMAEENPVGNDGEHDRLTSPVKQMFEQIFVDLPPGTEVIGPNLLLASALNPRSEHLKTYIYGLINACGGDVALTRQRLIP